MFAFAEVLPNGLIAAGKPRALVPSDSISLTAAMLQRRFVAVLGVNRLITAFLVKVIPLPHVERTRFGRLWAAVPTRSNSDDLPALLLTMNALLKTPR